MQRKRLSLRFVGLVSALTMGATMAVLPTASAHAAGTSVSIPDYTFTSASAAMTDVRRITRADVAHKLGYTGKGVGIALIDTGVVPVEGLTSGNVANGPDLSLESQVPGLQWRDTYGHGTYLAGIIAGRDNASGSFRGIAPDAKLTSIKVGMANGAVDVTQMMAAVDWVVAHRNDDPANPIRVINLSYGTDSTLDWWSNPLTHAVENAYRAGILVIIAAGNTGGKLTSPAFDPYVTTVGAIDPRGTTNPSDDVVAPFSSTSFQNYDEVRRPNVYAPGKSIVSLRDPGSYVDLTYPSAQVGDRYLKGSGTSQAAAVISGAAAVFMQKYPTKSIDSVRCSLSKLGTPLAGSASTDPRQVNLETALTSTTSWTCSQSGDQSDGNGSLQSARGTSVVNLNGAALTGERDIFGPLSSSTWASASSKHTSWQGGSWMGRPWTGTGWTTPAYGQANWAGRAWSGRAWSGRAWSDLVWSGATWTGRAWSNTTFNGASWAGATWSGVSWLSGADGKWIS